MSRKNDVRATAAESTHTAVERGSAILEQVIEAIQPLLATAQEKAADARDQVQPYANVAKDRLSPVTDQAKEKLAPLAASAAVGSVGLAHKTKEQLQPHLDTLGEKVQPAVNQARDKVQDELVPQLVDLLHQAEQHPAVSEASRRGQATVAALRGDLALPEEKKKRNAAAVVAKTAAVTALLAAAAVAVRQFLASKDDAWTAHQPSQAYVPSQEPASTNTGAPEKAPVAPPVTSDDSVAKAPSTAPEPQRVQPQRSTDDATLDAAETDATRPVAQDRPVAQATVSEPNPHEQMSAEGGPVRGAETTNEDLHVLNAYGENSYVGDEPPSNYTVKGNERSMKFHTPDSAGYERTIADVWFSSPEAAEQAGFTRAQR